MDPEEDGPSSLVHAELLDATVVAEREEALVGTDVEVTVGEADITDVIGRETRGALLDAAISESNTGVGTASAKGEGAIDCGEINALAFLAVGIAGA